MASEKVTQLVDQVKELTVLELSELYPTRYPLEFIYQQISFILS